MCMGDLLQSHTMMHMEGGVQGRAATHDRHTHHFGVLLVAEGQLVGCEHQGRQREADALVPASSEVFSCCV